MGTSLMAEMVKNQLAKQESQVRSLDREDLLEKGMTLPSSFCVWEVPWKEEPGRLHSPWGCKEWNRTEELRSDTI